MGQNVTLQIVNGKLVETIDTTDCIVKSYTLEELQTALDACQSKIAGLQAEQTDLQTKIAMFP